MVVHLEDDELERAMNREDREDDEKANAHESKNDDISDKDEVVL